MSELVDLTRRLDARQELSAADVAVAARALASPEIKDEDKGAFLTALAVKGETASEVAAFAREFRSVAIDPGVSEWAPQAIDIVGTGGDHAGGFNISSMVVLTLASAGVPVMKHGNRGITSKCGSADLLAALGVNLEASHEKIRSALRELGYVFFFAPAYHPTFKFIGPVRKALAAKGQRTVFNILGPLINPGRPAHVILGVFSEAWVPKLAEALDALGTTAGLAAHGILGEGRGIDELTTATPNRVKGAGRLRGVDGVWNGSEHGFAPANFDDLKGGDLAQNLAITEAILLGRGPAGLVDTIVFNAATAMWVCGKTASIAEGVARARELLLGGAVKAKIAATKEFLSFMKRIYFGTDGVRGPYGGPVINEAFAERLGAAAGRFASRISHGGGGVHRVLIGRDTRASGESLLEAVAAGLASVGVDAVSLGVLPTPAVAAAVVREGAVLGVMITASHNPAADNGIKFFAASGMKLTDGQEAEIESLLPEEKPVALQRRSLLGAEGLATYLDKVRRLLPARALSGWKVVLDTANGATCTTSPVVLRELGAQVELIGGSPDGENINDGVGSEHPEKLAARVCETGARLGIAHDGDGDRCILCDERGAVLDGDEILAILATHALERGALVAKTLVVTVQSNLGVDAAIRAAGGRVVRTAVGDRYVLEGMLLARATLGGESSGHVICSEISPTGDGLVAALKVIEVMLATGKPLSELRGAMKKFPQGILNLKVREKRELAKLPHLPFAIETLEKELGQEGRVLVRYSGTEPKLRLLVEGPTDEIVRAGLARLESMARADLEVL